ncbi:MAG: hypothetical protein C0485_19210 [Pirellula sp.]|nr:hypothetical protein [Pirellula sp.]
MFIHCAPDHRRSLPAGLVLAAGIAAVLFVMPAFAATWTWDGGAGNDNWTNGQNWVGDVGPANNGTADIVFSGTTRLTPNLPVNWSINSLTFNNTAGSFDLMSSPQSNLTIGAGGIATFAANRQTFDHLLELRAPQTWTTAPNSGGLTLVFWAPVLNGGHLLTMNVEGGSIVLGGTLKGSGGLTKEGLGDLVLNPFVIAAGNNSYTGTTIVNAGQLYLSGHELLTSIPGELRIGDGGGTAIDSVLNQNHNQIANSASVSIAPTGAWALSNFSEAITNLDIVSTGVANGASVSMTSGTLTLLGNLTMTGGSVTASAGGKLLLTSAISTNTTNIAATIGSDLDLNAGARVLTVDDGAVLHDLNVSGVVSNGAIVKNGTGALRLGAANTFGGGTTLNEGTIIIGHDAALGTGALTVNGGTLRADGGARTIANPLTLNASFTVDGASDLALNTIVTFVGDITKNGVGALTFAQPGVIGGALAVNAGVARFDSDVTIAGALTNSGTVLIATGTLAANGAGLNNQGSLALAGGTLAGNGTVVNNGLVSGSGTIDGAGGFTNNAQLVVSGGNLTLAKAGANANAGEIEVQAGRQLQLYGGTLTNTGTVDLGGGIVAGAANFSNITGGIVSGRGTISAPMTNAGGTLRAVGGTLHVTSAFANSGVIRLDDAAGLAGGAITNAGRIQGDGTIANSLTNAAGGSIRVDVGNTLFFRGAFAANVGELNLQGGTLDFAGAVTNSAAGFIAGRGALYTGGLTNSGQMAFSGGLADIHGDVTLTAGARVVTSSAGTVTTFFDDMVHNGLTIFTAASASTVFFGNQSGAGSFTGTGTVYYIGDLRPGSSPGTVSYAGSVVLGSATTLAIELGGSASAQYDQIHVTGGLSLGGDLEVSFINGFSPTAGQTFNILDWGSLSGTFSVLDLPALGRGLAWNTSTLYSSGVLSVALDYTADFDQDSDVDAADLSKWKVGFGTPLSATHMQGDANGDGAIDGADFLAWQRQLGSYVPAVSANAPVPEPSTSMLVIVAAVGIRKIGGRLRRKLASA